MDQNVRTETSLRLSSILFNTGPNGHIWPMTNCYPTHNIQKKNTRNAMHEITCYSFTV